MLQAVFKENNANYGALSFEGTTYICRQEGLSEKRRVVNQKSIDW